MLFYFAAIAGFLLDQAIKFAVHKNLGLGQSIPLAGKYIKLTFVKNSGAAFSLFQGSTLFLIIISILAIIAIIYFYFITKKNGFLTQAGLALLLGGSLGNLFDRIVWKYVIDYIDLSFWPVFNLADIMINCGVFLLIIGFVFNPARGTKNASHPS